GPGEALAVETLRVVDVGRQQLVPDERARVLRRIGQRRERGDDGALRIRDDRHAADLGHVHRLGQDLSASTLGAEHRLVDVLDEDVPHPVRWRGPGRRTEASLELPVRLDHLVGDLAGLETFGIPTEQVHVELCRGGWVLRSMVVPDELAYCRLNASAHRPLLLWAKTPRRHDTARRESTAR